MLIERTLYSSIKKTLLAEPKVIILYGPRQSGKTTLIKSLISELNQDYLFFDGDDLYSQEIFSKPYLDNLERIIGNKKFLLIDEAQRIENIGLTLKLIYDNLNIPILASGSSSFDLANKLSESLVGRTSTFLLYPLSFAEIHANLAPASFFKEKLAEFLRFGLYPKTFTLTGEEEKQNYLNEVINNYLYKDLLSFEGVRKPKKAVDLLTLLALQVGQEVSVAELSRNLAISRPAVENYLDVLEKMFVIKNLRGLSRNLRKEVYKNSKYYFFDLGIRNALIRNFNPLNLRDDVGAMFENFCFMERIKLLQNNSILFNNYFWRTYDQKEIDYVEEREGRLFGFEFKWNPKAYFGPIQEFLKTYPQSSLKKIDQENCLPFFLDT